MDEVKATPPPLKKGNGILQKAATMLKVAVMGALVLVLLIPLGMIKRVMHERQYRYEEAVREITSTWGKRQEIVGPVLVVPYEYEKTVTRTDKNDRTRVIEEEAVGYAHFLPDALQIDGVLEHSQLKRGIYETVVFGADVKCTGFFSKPDLEQFGVKKERDIQWDKAYITLGVSDMRGTREEVAVVVGGRTCKVEPGCRLKGIDVGVYADVGEEDLEKEKVPFEVRVTLNGSGGIRFAPLGKQTTARVESKWPDPSFQGGVLPTERKVTDSGFNALWEVSYYGRNYPQAWTTASGFEQADTDAVKESLFGVDLIDVVDSYRFVERSIKYGMLFIVLVFTAFFLFEVMSSVKVHPFQYVLVGAALCLFYMALLSLSEVIAFGLAYGAGALAATLLISLYSAKVLKGRRRGFKVFLGLAAVYGILYVVLRQQDYSLLYGTVGLFAALAVVMYVTRNIDWYSRDRREN